MRITRKGSSVKGALVKRQFSRFVVHQIAIRSILEKKINIYNFYVYQRIAIWLISTIKKL